MLGIMKTQPIDWSDNLTEREAPLNMNGEQFRKLGQRLVDQIAEFLDGVRDRPVTRESSPAAIRKLLRSDELPVHGTPANELFEEVSDLLFDHSLLNGHPRFWGYITSSPAPIGKTGSVVATDASATMLALLQKKCVCALVVAKVPDLPFGDSLFDRVTASFVVSHFKDYRSGLSEMVRVLQPGGRLGISAWVPGQNPYADAWAEIGGRFANIEELARCFNEVIPWEELLSTEDNLQLIFKEAGLDQVEIERHKYTILVTSSDYLAMRESSVEGTFLRRSLEEPEWQRFKNDLAETFRIRFPEEFSYDREVLFAIGTRPAG